MIGTEDRRSTYTTDGLVTVFDIDFETPPLDGEASWVRVTTVDADGVETELADGVDYTRAVASIETTAVLPADLTLIISRDVPVTQEVDLVEGGAFSAETTERSIDKLTAQAQEQEDEIARTIQVPFHEETGYILPTAVERANRYIRFDGSGDLGLAWLGDAVINWLGEFASAPSPAANGDAYHNTSDDTSYIYDEGNWYVLAAQGATGATGPAGADGIDGVDGTNGTDGEDGTINWLSTVTYDADDVVAYDGKIYLSLQGTNLNQQPDTATTYWAVLVPESKPITTTSISYTIDAEDKLIAATAGGSDITLTLPAASGVADGQEFEIHKVDSGAGRVAIARDGTNTIDGVTTVYLDSQYDMALVRWVGTYWTLVEYKDHYDDGAGQIWQRFADGTAVVKNTENISTTTNGYGTTNYANSLVLIGPHAATTTHRVTSSAALLIANNPQGAARAYTTYYNWEISGASSSYSYRMGIIIMGRWRA